MAERYPLQHAIRRLMRDLRAVEQVVRSKGAGKPAKTLRGAKRLLRAYARAIKKEDAATVAAFFEPDNLAWLTSRLKTMATKSGVKFHLLRQPCSEANVDYDAMKAEYDAITGTARSLR